MIPYPKETLKKISKTVFKKGVVPTFNAAYEFDRKHGGRMVKNFFKSFEWLYALAYIPALRDRIPALDPNLSDVSTIPINKDIQGAEGIALPEEVLDRLIDISNYRVILDSCACRRIYGCKTYPQDIGCIFMGESAKRIPKDYSREASVGEAKAHVRKAIAAGLVPIVGEARADYELLRIPYEGKLVTNCFCCECCCLSRAFRRGPVETVDGILHPVEGLSVEVTETCVGCGTCVTKCFIGAIQVRAGRAVIDDYCRVCGRCAGACPHNAIKLKLENPHAVDDVVNRILAKVDLS
jgi:UDP-glucose 4-epimerase